MTATSAAVTRGAFDGVLRVKGTLALGAARVEEGRAILTEALRRINEFRGRTRRQLPRNKLSCASILRARVSLPCERAIERAAVAVSIAAARSPASAWVRARLSSASTK